MSDSKISVIIPVYNGSKSLENCVRSIIKQTYKRLEIILVDDGSKDNSLDICKKIAKDDDRIRVYSKENGGASSARNYGVEKSTANFIEFVDCDDTLEPDYIESMFKPFLEYKDLDLTIGGFTLKSTDKVKKCVPQFSGLLSKLEFNKKDLFLKLYKDEFAFLDSPINKIYRKEKFKPFDLTVTISEDKIQNIEYLAESGHIYLVQNSGYNYIMTENSLTHRRQPNLHFDLQKADNYLISYIRSNIAENCEDVICTINIETLLRVVRHMFSYNASAKSIKEVLIKMIQDENLYNTIHNYKNNDKYKKVAKILSLKLYSLFIILYKINTKIKKIDLTKI